MRAVVILVLGVLLPAAVQAQVDPRGDWRTMRTPHFNIHVRAEHLSIGRAAAAEAESAYVALSARLRPPRGRIDVVVADNVDFSNGFATVYPRPRVVIYAVPPAGDVQLGMYHRWLRLVLTHELAHVFHLDLARGWWGLGRKVLGRAPFLFPNIYAPGWIIEGTAVWFESELTGAGRRSGSFHRSVLGAEAAEQSGMSVSEASISSAEWPGGIRSYAWGSEFFAAAHDTTLPSFIRRSAGVLLPWVQLSSAYKGASGASIGSAWNRAFNARRETGRPQGPLLRGLRIIVTPRLSPDGRRLLLAYNDGHDATRLVTFDLATRERREVARLNDVNAIAWENDTSVLVSQTDFVDAYNVRSDLWRIVGNRQSAIGNQWREERLTRGARILDFDVRDGKVVAVRLVPGGTELVQVLPAERLLQPVRPNIDWSAVRWSPDGRWITAVRVVGGWHDVMLMDSNGVMIAGITADSVRDLTPSFTPDSRSIVWSREVDGVPQIVSRSIEPGIIRRLSDEPFGALAPTAGRDTTWYFAYRADGYALASTDSMVDAVDAPDVMALDQGRVPGDPDLRNRRYSSFPALLPRYWLPLAFAADGGAWLGALTSGNDPLVRHNYVASLEMGFGRYTGQWRATLGYTHTGPGTSLLDASFSRSRQAFIADSTGTIRCCLPDEAANAGITFVRRRVRAQSNLRLGATYERDGLRERAGGLATMSWSRVITPAMAISTQDGGRLSAQLRVRKRLDAPLAAADIAMRATAYRSFGRGELFARPVSALRVAAGTVIGNDNLAYNVGGESGGSVSLIPGLPALGSTRSYPVRGYAGSFLTGRHVATLSLEQRVPLAYVGRNLGLMPLGLEHLSATAFADFGVAYSRQYCASGSDGRCPVGIASVGAELGTMLMMGYDLPLLARVGAGVRLKHAGGLGAYATVGSSF